MQLKKLLILVSFLCTIVKVNAQQSEVSTLPSDSTSSQEIDSVTLSRIVALNVVRVKATRHQVRQTLNGYEYFPGKDSAYRNESLFVALQRLPFVNVTETRLDYKDGKKIWFRINGKDRKGIGDNWKEILQSLPAKGIHKVELVTDIPVLIRNQGYDVLINIITSDNGLRGKAFNAAGILDSRRNFNQDAGATFLKRKNDHSFKIAAKDQGYESNKRTEVFKDGVLKSQNLLANNYYYSRWHAGASWGLRPDSLKDFSASLNYSRVNRNDRWTNLFNHPSTLNDFTNTFVQLSSSIDLSYVQRKKKYERSFVFAGRSGHEDFNNRIGHTGSSGFDSLNNVSTTRSQLGIFEFNQLKRKKNSNVEFGGQAYAKILLQSIHLYDVDPATNKARNIISGKEDSLEVYQVSVRPYFKLQRMLGAKRMVTLEADANWHWIKSASISNHLILPSISISEKRLLSRNRSLTTDASFYFQKPSEEYFKTVQISSDPSTMKTGSQFLKASKNIELEAEYILERKFIISQKISASYGFDQLNFFSHYDSVAGNLNAISSNGAETFSINYEAGVNRSFRDRFVMSLTSEMGFASTRHELAGVAYQGWIYGITSHFSYNLKKLKTILGFLSITRSDMISSGSRSPGVNSYTLYCSRRMWKNSLIISISAENFFQKDRTFRYVFLNKREKILNSTVMPVRLFSFRLAYRFSDIRSAMAKKRSTFIQNESAP